MFLYSINDIIKKIIFGIQVAIKGGNPTFNAATVVIFIAKI